MSSDNETANNKPSATEDSSLNGRVKWFNNKGWLWICYSIG